MKKTILLCCLGGALAGLLPFLNTGCAASGTHQSTGEYIDDTSITTRVKSAFVADDTVKAHDVSVETFNGTVQLSGFVDTEAERTHAEQIARNTKGVRDVVNNIRLKPVAK